MTRHPWSVSLMAALASLAICAVAPAQDVPIFRDISLASDLGFSHWNGMTGALYFPEMTGVGGAFFDYDGDGDLDLYLVQGALLGPGDTYTDALVPWTGDGVPRDRLLRNDALPGRDGHLVPRFVDVTDRAGLAATGYGMGVATGDFDNDGHVDLYVTNYGANQLWHNRGDGTFEEVAAAAGVEVPGWSTSALFADFDGDGLLDLYVIDYVDYRVAENPRCFASSSRQDYCGPSSFPPMPDHLFRNLGPGPDGRPRFEDVTARWLRGDSGGPGLGAVVADFDGDGREDLYVANDGSANRLWLRRGDGAEVYFEDDALLAGVAVNLTGQPEASMGVDAGDIDGDGDPDLVLAHLMGETNTLYVNGGGGLFTDRSTESGLAAPSLGLTAFGAGFLDVDNDGQLDFLAVNGAVKVLEEQAQRGVAYPLAQPNQLFRNIGGGRFIDWTAAAGPSFAVSEVSRGAAFGDVDNDGDADVLVTNSSGPARLLENTLGQGNRWLGLRLRASGRDAIGALATVRRGADGEARTRRTRTDGSYLSAHDPRVVAGFGADPARSLEARVNVTWPDGRSTRWQGLPFDFYITLRH